MVSIVSELENLQAGLCDVYFRAHHKPVTLEKGSGEGEEDCYIYG